MIQRSARRPHLLLVAMHFPPSRASGVFRPLAMANHLVRAGWDVTVVTVDRGFFEHVTRSSDPLLEESVDPRVDVVRATIPRGALVTDLSDFGYLRANFPIPVQKAVTFSQNRLFPDRYNAWLPSVVAAAMRVHARRRVDLVLSTGNPWTAFGAAWALRRTARIPYVMDYRDSWTLDQFAAGDTFRPGHPALRWERRLVADAERVLFVNEPMREWHAARYPDRADRMRVVENGYDSELLGVPDFRPPDPARPLRLGYVGTVTPQLPHVPFWQGWALARDEPVLRDATVTLYGHLGFFERTVAEVRAMIPHEPQDRVVIAGPLAKAAVRGAYEALDVLVMLIPSSRYVTGGKVYEYMASGRPIVAVHTPETAATGPLSGYPLWFPVREMTPRAVADALVAGAGAARSTMRQQYESCLHHARQFERGRVLDVMEADLREVVERGRRR